MFPPSGVQASESSTSSVASPNSVGGGAGEFDNIDSFDIHPGSGRWAETDLGFTSTVSDGLLNMSDIGDGTADSVTWERDLRDMSGVIETRFMFESNGTGLSYSNRFIIRIFDEDDDWAYLVCDAIKGGGVVSRTLIYIEGFDASNNYKNLAGSEVTHSDIWYNLRIDYDILQSSIRFRLYFDNGSKIFDYFNYDVTTVHASIFKSSALTLSLSASSYVDKQTLNVYVDYVNAPFKEREWSHFDDASDPQWLSENWDSAYVENDTVDTSKWRLVVPNLDFVSGLIKLNTTDNDAIHGDALTEDMFDMYFTVYTVDADDGDLHAGVVVGIGLRGYDGGFIGVSISVEVDGVPVYGVTHIQPNVGSTYNPAVSFTISTSVDRSKLSLQARCWLDEDTPDEYFDLVGSGLVSSMSTVPSQEFVLETCYSFALLEGDVDVTMIMSNFELISATLFHDWGPGQQTPSPPDASSPSVDAGFFQALFDAIAAFISWVLSPISELIDGVISGIVEIAGEILSGLGGALEFITEAIGVVVGTFIDSMSGLLDALLTQLAILAEDAADLLFDIIDFLIVLVLDIVGEIWALIEGTIFFIWDAVGLPNLIDLFNELLAYSIELIDWLLITFLDVVDLVNDLSWLILFFWWAWAIPIQWARAEFNPLGGVANFIEVYFYDALPWTVIGVHIYIPQGIIFTLWLILLLPGDFAFFTVLG